MYTSFAIENFRLFDRLTIEPLARVNLIIGKNNAGKTALLEALWLHSLPSPRSAQRLGAWRGLPIMEYDTLFADLFHGYRTDAVIQMRAKRYWGDGLTGGVGIQLPLNPVAASDGTVDTALEIYKSDDDEIVFAYSDINEATKFTVRAWLNSDFEEEQVGFRHRLRTRGHIPGWYRGPTVFINAGRQFDARETAARFGKGQLTGHIDNVQSVLKLAEPRLRGLIAVPKEQGPALICGDIGIGRIIPLALMGDGLRRLLDLALSFNDAAGNVIFIDEIENGLHHSVLVDVWKQLNDLSRKFNVQVFATTHSYECMEAARDAFKEAEDDDLLIHRVSRRENNVVATTYPFDGLDFTINYGAEIR